MLNDWKERFKLEGGNALANDSVQIGESKKFNWSAITKTILNQHNPDHHRILRNHQAETSNLRREDFLDSKRGNERKIIENNDG